MARQQQEAFPLFKGATRVATFAGVPFMAFLYVCIFVASIAMLFSLWLWLLMIPFWIVMAAVTKHDDKAFRIWGLWFETKFRNRNKAFWNGSTYSTARYRKKRK
ncbi:VirB3 family type IV secretion system protein [Sphingomonas sp. RRHST34]|jgi:type IV secretion system protein VirB3|uniref:VirB3 family type IV secretion system protein n=1 Tax=Sphingomonas citri TaxID=2862499 RepID=A0ABS7BUB8_9SPHN|nr:VirB3 family type IV secretion system protein [Sphingomonas citri]MBW6533196.1 VirB3 family type IV secretion system protein [Sphingomonas citri]